MRFHPPLAMLLLLPLSAWGQPLRGLTSEEQEKADLAYFKQASPEVRLAMVHAQAVVSPSAPLAAEYGGMLKRLRTAYKQSDKEIAELTITYVIKLRGDKAKAVPMDVMDTFTFFARNPKSAPDPDDDARLRDYREDISCYYILRQGGNSHTLAAMLFVDLVRLGETMEVGGSNGGLPLPSRASSLPPGKVPASDPKAASLLKMGQGLEKSGKQAAALKYYGQVVKEHPGTAQAKAAAARVKALAK